MAAAGDHNRIALVVTSDALRHTVGPLFLEVKKTVLQGWSLLVVGNSTCPHIEPSGPPPRAAHARATAKIGSIFHEIELVLYGVAFTI